MQVRNTVFECVCLALDLGSYMFARHSQTPVKGWTKAVKFKERKTIRKIQIRAGNLTCQFGIISQKIQILTY